MRCDTHTRLFPFRDDGVRKQSDEEDIDARMVISSGFDGERFFDAEIFCPQVHTLKTVGAVPSCCGTGIGIDLLITASHQNLQPAMIIRRIKFLLIRQPLTTSASCAALEPSHLRGSPAQYVSSMGAMAAQSRGLSDVAAQPQASADNSQEEADKEMQVLKGKQLHAWGITHQ